MKQNRMILSKNRPLKSLAACLAVGCGCMSSLGAGPYSLGSDDPTNPHDAPLPGFVGPHGIGLARIDDGFGEFSNPDNYVNPLFFGWAGSWEDYLRADGGSSYNDESYATGEVTGEVLDVVSLGDLNATRLGNGDPPGRITMVFETPIRNRTGADFAVFENALVSQNTTADGSVIGQSFAELAYVEVSNNGVDFLRFPSRSLTAAAVGTYGTIDPTNVRNLAGKHGNGYGKSWGTPFDLEEVGLDHVTHVRLIDIPGRGDFVDSEGSPIYDGWLTLGSGGFDLEAIGAVSIDMTYDDWPALPKLPTDQRGENDDPDKDGIANLLEYAFGLVPWEIDPPVSGWGFSLVSDGDSTFFELTTLRDERLLDLTREIQVSSGMDDWETIAVSTAGAPFAAANGQAVSIAEESASDIASIGVIRRDRVRDLDPIDGAAPRFYRLKVSRSAP